jgi:hypothetical protein
MEVADSINALAYNTMLEITTVKRVSVQTPAYFFPLSLCHEVNKRMIIKTKTKILKRKISSKCGEQVS